jgi:hypothetical protein
MKKLFVLIAVLLVAGILGACGTMSDAITESSVYTDMSFVKGEKTGAKSKDYYLYFKKAGKQYKFETSSETFDRMINTANAKNMTFDLIGDKDDIFGIAPSANRK